MMVYVMENPNQKWMITRGTPWYPHFRTPIDEKSSGSALLPLTRPCSHQIPWKEKCHDTVLDCIMGEDTSTWDKQTITNEAPVVKP